MSSQRVYSARARVLGFAFFLGLGQAEAQTAAVALPAAPVAAPEPSVGGIAVTPEWVVSQLLSGSTTLEIAQLTTQQSREATRLEDGRRPYTFQADAGYTRTRAPSLSSQGVVVTERDSVVVGTQLSKTYSSGTTATLRVEGERFDSSRASSASSAVVSSTGLGYQTSVRATVTQPLLSGYGATVNEAGLRQAQINEVRLRRSYERQTSELIRDALSAYWELWYAGRGIEIQDSALRLAVSQQKDADAKVAQGALSAADALKFRAQVATLNETLLSAQASQRKQALELGRMLGSAEQAFEWRAAPNEPQEQSFLARSELMVTLRTNSPQIADLKEALRLAQEKRRTAGDEYRSSLDLTAWVEAAGMAAGEHVAPAVRQVGRLGAVSTYGGVVYQTSLDSKQLSAARAQADYAVRIADSNLKLAVQELESQASQLLVTAEQAKVSLEAAMQTLEVTTQQAQNERQRFALGAATPLDVQVAEDALRQAQLRVVRAKVDRVKSWLSLAHASGELLRRYPMPVSSAQRG